MSALALVLAAHPGHGHAPGETIAHAVADHGGGAIVLAAVVVAALGGYLLRAARRR